MADLITFDEYEMAGGDPEAGLGLLAISAASDLVRGYLHQQISLVEDDVVTLTGTGTRALLIPELPVVAINSVTVGDDPPLTAADYRAAGGLLWRVSDWGRTVWPVGFDIVVDYDHGYATIPADIRLVAARLAVAITTDSTSPQGLRQEAIQDYSYSRADVTAILDAELAVISRRVLRQVPLP